MSTNLNPALVEKAARSTHEALTGHGISWDAPCDTIRILDGEVEE